MHRHDQLLYGCIFGVVLLLMVGGDKALAEWISRLCRGHLPQYHHHQLDHHDHDHYPDDHHHINHYHCSAAAHRHPAVAPLVNPTAAVPPLPLARPARLLLEVALAEDARFADATQYGARASHDWPAVLFTKLLPDLDHAAHLGQVYVHRHAVVGRLLSGGDPPQELEEWATAAKRLADALNSHNTLLDTLRQGYAKVTRHAARPEQCFTPLGWMRRPLHCAALRIQFAPDFVAAVQTAVPGFTRLLDRRRTQLQHFESFCRTSLLELDDYRLSITAHILRHSRDASSPIPPDYVQVLRTYYLASTIATVYLQTHLHQISTHAIPFLDTNIAQLHFFSTRLSHTPFAGRGSNIHPLLPLESSLREELDRFASDLVPNLTTIVLVPDRATVNAVRASKLDDFWSPARSVPLPDPRPPKFCTWFGITEIPNALHCPSWKAWYLDSYDIDGEWKDKLQPAKTWDEIFSTIDAGCNDAPTVADKKGMSWSMEQVLNERLIGA